ncbi:MAG: response regulator [Glaciecola sp.]
MKKPAQILLVEDSKSDQVMVQRALEDGRIRCELVIANNGNEALKMLTDSAQYKALPHLILMDINMPIMDGKQTLKAIRDNQQISHIPVIMLTTSSREKDVMESYQLGVNAYLTKPIVDADFLKIISRIEDFWLEIVVLPKHSS